MLTYKEKLSLLNEMVSLSMTDGKLHSREHQFIKIIAQEFNVKESDLEELFHSNPPKVVIKSEFKRIEHFYRMALLMHSDHHKHEDEVEFLKNIAINLGLNPMAVRRAIDEMDKSPTRMLEPEVLLGIFKEQHN